MAWISHALSFVFFPWAAVYDPINVLVNADPRPHENGPSELAVQTKVWVENKIGELTLVGILCALLAATISAGFAWDNAGDFAWPALALWYAALLFSLASICIATQQSVSLRRLMVHRQGPQRVRHLLGIADESRIGHFRPRESQLWAWEVPIILLNYGIIVFCIGLGIIMWQNAALSWDGLGNRETKVAIAASVCALLAAGCYAFCLFSMYGGTGKDVA
ncbi:MAG: hypothetical protein M1838_001015 [Thelocarpon superellum]|nr:MAG: hypothetical protein M1838_001015 [Thelocarpon superellum]